ncbi:hypothetical protein ABENE_07675 [Asticcacaulis benevestitus DSM 16100 = ATCC BAA-896]|uniref:Uncharacterized protein n=1 Tax=Asticcacaulis benevestitus DSM 16100 = ATCC BAA-896 TaxID=1121022 RepID=V4PWF7_9CAUL|nr:hypothetical protein ABENE_07675 [Asticcacaulis benevestitus DSM 16100 = ATCC BAA-896]
MKRDHALGSRIFNSPPAPNIDRCDFRRDLRLTSDKIAAPVLIPASGWNAGVTSICRPVEVQAVIVRPVSFALDTQDRVVQSTNQAFHDGRQTVFQGRVQEGVEDLIGNGQSKVFDFAL